MAPGQLDHTQLAFSVACRRWMQNVGATTTYEVKNRLLIMWLEIGEAQPPRSRKTRSVQEKL